MATVDPFLARHLVHTVDVGQRTGHDSYNNETYEWYRRVKCLIDEASGRRRSQNEQGEMVTYSFAVTFPASLKPEIGWALEDARDEFGELIFERATVESVNVYRVPGKGTIGYLTMVSSAEENAE